MIKTLIAGCGKIGSQLGLELAARGHTVTGITRCSQLPAPLLTLNADLSISDTLLPLTKQYDYVFYAAAAKEYTQSAYERAYVEGLANLLSRLQQIGMPKRFIFVSSTSVYGQQDGSWVDETSLTENPHFSGNIIRQAERLLEPIAGSVCVRFAGIYGPQRMALLNSVLHGTASLSQASIITNRIHERDCVAVLQFLADLQGAQKIYLACDHEPTNKNQILVWLAERLGCDMPAVSVTASSHLRGNKRCSNKRLCEAGYQFIYPSYREGYQEILENRK